VLPLTIASVIAGVSAGLGVSWVGYLPPFAMAATAVSAIGTGLLYMLYPGSTTGQWLGYQIVAGAGFGLAIEQSIVNAQAVVSSDDVGYATSAILLVNIVGGAVAIGISQALFSGEVLKLVGKLPGVGEETLLNDFNSLGQLLSPEDLETAVAAYQAGLKQVFLLALILCAISAVAWPFLPWKSIKSKSKKSEGTESSSTAPTSEDEQGKET
jgi:hypothetical protein